MSMFWIQLIGFGGATLQISAFQCKNNRWLFTTQLAAYCFWITHFILLDALSGSITLFLGALRNFVLAGEPKGWRRWLGWRNLFIAAYFVTMLCTWKGWVSVLPFVGMTVSTWAAWTRNGKIIRIAGLTLASPLWLVYDGLESSIPGVLCEVFCIASMLVSIWRYGWKALDTES